MTSERFLGPGLHVLQRGWLSSNNVLLDSDDGATLVDSGHCVHAAQTVALLRQSLGDQPLRQLINTHLHSDHCGGNAAVQREWAPQVRVPSGSLKAVQAWDEQALSYAPTRQRCERYTAHGSVAPGQVLRIGTRQWEVMAAPGHDPESVILFDAAHGVLISADALWENGFGVVFPELDGATAFDDVARVLDLIETLPVRCVIPGHGAPFNDVAGALRRARSRLAGFRANPERHLRHGAKVLLKYHLMEERAQSLPALRDWLRDTPLMQSIWSGLARPEGEFAAWAERLLQELLTSGVLAQRGDIVHDV
ncbi:MAG: MBL fold metallo-hydrolase [Burkholderiaceae bacterium]|jgi:glyoxylase-like metal-dependent hydrolase (beta-lactamase superfamily II)|nr:MBL fold metallo-hydrolase [Burkholderiaceae bacterium]